jgi:D-proline reductase (dithiol) PrdB
MLEMSRKCVPYTPVTSKLQEMRIALVSATGVYLEGQEPYLDHNDDTYRILPADLDAKQTRIKHGHYDSSDAEKDINCVFPIDRLRELADEGLIKAVSNKHIGFKGASTDLKRQYEYLAPKIAHEIEHSQADGVILTGGCPLCHRVVGAVQREIEGKGIPTVMITVVPQESKTMRPPRAIHPVGHTMGRVLGIAGDSATQKKTLREALHQFEKLNLPGLIIDINV